MEEIIRKRRELIEDHVLRIALQLGALVVDFLDVAFGAGGADDVVGMGNPSLQPLEPLPAHAGGKHGNTAATEKTRNQDAAAAIIPGRRPDPFFGYRDKTAGHQLNPRNGNG